MHVWKVIELLSEWTVYLECPTQLNVLIILFFYIYSPGNNCKYEKIWMSSYQWELQYRKDNDLMSGCDVTWKRGTLVHASNEGGTYVFGGPKDICASLPYPTYPIFKKVTWKFGVFICTRFDCLQLWSKEQDFKKGTGLGSITEGFG